MYPQLETSSVIETESGPIPTKDFSYFLYLLRAAYVAGLVELPSSGGFEVTTDAQVMDFVAAIERRILNLSEHEITELALFDLHPDEDLTIADIHRRNPVDVVFAAVTLPLVAAVILSGGSFQLGPLKVKLPPLGTGIEKLRAAFGRTPRRKNKP